MSETIFVGDTFPIVVAWSIPSVENPYQPTDAVVTSATVRVVYKTRRALVVADQAADVVGNETRFIVPSESNARSGAYTAYITAHFNDDTVITKQLDYYVRPKN